MNRFKNIITYIVISAFLAQNISWAKGFSPAGAGNPPPIIPQSINQIDKINDFYIPETYGYIAKKTIPKDTDKPVLILIEDAHCISEIQSNIANIIKYLVNNYNLKKVCLEGASGVVNTSPFKEYPDKKKRSKVMSYYLEEGILNGVEFLSITEGKNISLGIEGIEDEELYLNNLDVFRRHYSGIDSAEKLLKDINSILDRIKHKHYSPELLELDNKGRLYDLGELPLADYITWLKAFFNNSDFQEKNWEQAYLISKLISLEDKIDFNCIEKERSQLIECLSQNLPMEDKKELVEKALLVKLSKISTYTFYEYLSKYLTQIPSIERKSLYPNLSRYIRLLYLQRYMDFLRLEDELAEMRVELLQKMRISMLEREIYRAGEMVFLWDRLIHLKINNKQFQYYKELQQEIGAGGVLSLVGRYDVYSTRGKKITTQREELEKYIISAEEFYGLAKDRDSVITKNINAIASANGDKYLALVVGGFHSDAIQQKLKKLGYSYIVITPRLINKPAQEKYVSVMLSPHINLNSSKLKNSTLPPPVVTSGTGHDITSYPEEMAGRLTDGGTFELLSRHFRGLTPDEISALQKLCKMGASLRLHPDKLGEFREEYVRAYNDTKSPTFRQALVELFGDIIGETPAAPQQAEAVSSEGETPAAPQQAEAEAVFGEGETPAALRQAEAVSGEEDADSDMYAARPNILQRIFTEQKYFKAFQWITFLLFMFITASQVLFGNAVGIIGYIQHAHILLVIAYAVINILRSYQNMRNGRVSLKDTIVSPAEQRSFFGRMVRSPLFWFLTVSLLLLVNTYLYEGITGVGLGAKNLSPDLWNSLFSGLKDIISAPVKEMIVGKVNDVLAIPFVVYAFLTILKLYNSKLYTYFNKSFFKPALITGTGLAFIFSEFRGGITRILLKTTYNYRIDDMTDYYAYIAVMAVMLGMFFIGRAYDYIKNRKAVSLEEAFHSIGRVKYKALHILTFFVFLIPFVYFMYFMYTIPFFHSFSMLYNKLPIIIAMFVALPVVFWARNFLLNRLEKKTRIARERASMQETSKVSFLHQWGGMFMILFSGVSLLIRYLWSHPNGSTITIILAIPFISAILIWCYQKTRDKERGDGYASTLTKPSTTFFISSIFGVLTGVLFANKGLSILDAFKNHNVSNLSWLGKLIGEFLYSFYGFFGGDLIILFSICIFIAVFLFIYFVLWPRIGGFIERKQASGYEVESAWATADAAKVRPGQKRIPEDVVNSLINWIKQNAGQRVGELQKSPEESDRPIILVIPDNLNISGWSFKQQDFKYTARIENGAIFIEYQNDFDTSKESIEVYALRDESGEGGGIAIWLTKSLLDKISHDRCCLRQLALHETAEMLFQRNMQGGDGSEEERYEAFLDGFTKRIRKEWTDINEEYIENIKKLLSYRQVRSYFERSLSSVSGNDIAELVERIDTVLLGSKRYDFNSLLNSLNRLDPIVMYSDLDWTIFYQYLKNRLGDIELIESHDAKKVFEQHPDIYIEDVMADFSKDTDGLKKFLAQEGILKKIDNGYIESQKIEKEMFFSSKEGLIKSFRYIMIGFWIVSLVGFFISFLSLDANMICGIFMPHSLVFSIFSIVLTIYYVYIKFIYKKGKPGANIQTFWGWVRKHPATALIIVIGLLLLNQYIFNALALYQGSNFVLPSFFPKGWFGIVQDPSMFGPILGALQFMQSNMPTFFNSVVNLSIMRVNAFLELPFALFAYFTIVRLLNKDLYYFIKKSWYTPLAIFSFTAVLCVIEVFLPNPFTMSDIIFRLMSAFFFLGLFILGKIKDFRRREKISFPAENIDKIPHKGFNLIVFFTGFISISVLVLKIYRIALLYNFNILVTQLWPFILILAGVFALVYMKPVLMRVYGKLRERIFITKEGPETVSAYLFTYVGVYLLLTFFVPSLFIRYFLATWVGGAALSFVLLMTIIMSIYRLKQSQWTRKQVIRGIISIGIGITIGILSFVSNLFGLGFSATNLEGVIINAAVTFFAPMIFASIGIESIFIKLSKEGKERKSFTRIKGKQVSKTRKGQPAVMSNVISELIKWIGENHSAEGVFCLIPDTISFAGWSFDDGEFVYTARLKRGEIEIIAKNKGTGEQSAMDVQAFRDGDGKIWLLKSTYEVIKNDINAKRQLCMHELAEDMFQKIWTEEGTSEEKYKRFLDRFFAGVTALEPRYESARNRFMQLLSYNNITQYFGGSLSIGNADRIGELAEKIDTLILGSYSGRHTGLRSLADVDTYVTISDLDWSLFYNTLKIALKEQGVIDILPSNELRGIFSGIEGTDVNLIREKLDDSSKLQDFISILKGISNACDVAGDAAGLKDTDRRKAGFALSISYEIFEQKIADGKIKELVGLYLAKRIEECIESKFTSDQQRAVWELIETLGNQIIKIEEKDGEKHLVVDNFSYLLSLELEKELGLKPFELVEALLKVRIFAGLVKNYNLENSLTPAEFESLRQDIITNREDFRASGVFRRKNIDVEGDPYTEFLQSNGISCEFVMTVADLLYQLANFRLSQGITHKDLSNFAIRIPNSIKSNVGGIVSRILSGAIENGIDVQNAKIYGCRVSDGWIKDELGDSCVSKNDMAKALVFNFGLPYQQGNIADIKNTLKAAVDSQLYEFSNSALYEAISPIFSDSRIADVELAVLDFEACFEIVEAGEKEVQIIPRSANIKDVLKRLSGIKKVCFASMNPDLIARHGEKIRYILGNVYGLNEFENVYLDAIFTGSVAEIASRVKAQFNLQNYNSTILIASQKNQGIVQEAVQNKSIPFRAVIANPDAPLSFALGLAILANSITKENISLLKEYFDLIGIDKDFSEIAEEIERNGFMLFILPSPKPIIKEMMNRLSATRITVDISA